MKQLPWSSFKPIILARETMSLLLIDFPGEISLYAKDSVSHHELECVIDKFPTPVEGVVSPIDDFTVTLLDRCSEPPILTVTTDALPFCQPTYRTKRAATSGLISVPVNSSAGVGIIYKLTSERYASGGVLIVENAELGDYLVATVTDYDGVIPEAYRSALCEAWPIVATYIEKEFIEVGVPGTIQAGSISRHRIDTAPLNAKITTGLYLTVRYYSVNSGLTRRMGVNYLLTKKL